MLDITEHYIRKFGSVTINVYQFPQEDGFGIFLDSLRITLLRHGILPMYLWILNPAEKNYILIHWCRGYYQGQVEQEAGAIIRRLWNCQSNLPYYLLESLNATQENQSAQAQYFSRHLRNYSLQQDHSADYKWHGRTFGSTHLS